MELEIYQRAQEIALERRAQLAHVLGEEALAAAHRVGGQHQPVRVDQVGLGDGAGVVREPSALGMTVG